MRAAALALLLLACHGLPQRQAHSRPSESGQRFSNSLEEQGDPRVGGFTSSQWSFHTASYWIEGPDGLLLIDSQFVPSALIKELNFAQRVSGKPARLAVLLEASPDRANGTGYLQSIGLPVLSSPEIRAAIPAVHQRWLPLFKDRYEPSWYPRTPALPDALTEETLRIAGLEVRVRRLGPGSAATHLVLEWEGHLFVGNLVTRGAHSWFEGGDLEGWLTRLEELRALRPRWIHPGRGMPGGPELLDAQAEFLREVKAAIASENPSGSSSPAALERIRQRLEARFPRAYPELLTPLLRQEWARQAAAK